MPISIAVKPSAWPEMVSKGRSEPMPICTRMMERSNADSEISSFMRRLPALSKTVPEKGSQWRLGWNGLASVD